MGAKFAPSVANALMAQWEESVIYSNTPVELTFYKRYIDDVLLVWNGTKDSLEEFLTQLNINDKNIKLIYNISDKQVSFLDLETTLSHQTFTTKTHFKNIDTNSYLFLNSCHFKSWLYNIPKGQTARIKINCTTDTDFLAQADFIGSRFRANGYSEGYIQQQIQMVFRSG